MEFPYTRLQITIRRNSYEVCKFLCTLKLHSSTELLVQWHQTFDFHKIPAPSSPDCVSSPLFVSSKLEIVRSMCWFDFWLPHHLLESTFMDIMVMKNANYTENPHNPLTYWVSIVRAFDGFCSADDKSFEIVWTSCWIWFLTEFNWLCTPFDSLSTKLVKFAPAAE